MSINLKVMLTREGAHLPTKSHNSDVGYDLYSAEDVTVPAGERKMIHTGNIIDLPQPTKEFVPGYMMVYGRVAPRSGLAHKHGIDVLAGVVDPGYKGEVNVILYNTGKEDYEIKQGDRIAQLILEMTAIAGIEEVTDMTVSDRGNSGFGSTGK